MILYFKRKSRYYLAHFIFLCGMLFNCIALGFDTSCFIARNVSSLYSKESNKFVELNVPPIVALSRLQEDAIDLY